MEPITITLHGSDRARHGGIEVKARGMAGPICPLARKLIEQGYNSERPVHVTRGQTQCFTPVTLGWWASKQCRESDKLSARFYDYQEFWGADQ